MRKLFTLVRLGPGGFEACLLIAISTGHLISLSVKATSTAPVSRQQHEDTTRVIDEQVKQTSDAPQLPYKSLETVPDSRVSVRLEILEVCECLYDGYCLETLQEFDGQCLGGWKSYTQPCRDGETTTHWRRAFDRLPDKEEMIAFPDNQWRCTNHIHCEKTKTINWVSICICNQNWLLSMFRKNIFVKWRIKTKVGNTLV